MVICLECGANDLHMVQYTTATSSSVASVQCRMVYLSDTSLPKKKKAVKCICVCVCACVCVTGKL